MNNITKNYLYEMKRTSLSSLEKKELAKRAFGIKKMLEEQDELLDKAYQEEHKMGYCPHCFSLLRLNGLCDNCD